MVARVKHTSLIRVGITAKKSGQKGFQYWPKKTSKLAKNITILAKKVLRHWLKRLLHWPRQFYDIDQKSLQN
jgi:hypothetical protein